MKAAKDMTDMELAERCTRHYTKEEMLDSIELSEEQIENGQYEVYDNKFMDDLRKRHSDDNA